MISHIGGDAIPSVGGAMAKVKPEKRIQKYRTEDEARRALSDLCKKKGQMSIPPQDDDSDIILTDVIEELLEKRSLLEQIKGFVMEWAPKLTQRSGR
jgi:hypothetical protein